MRLLCLTALLCLTTSAASLAAQQFGPEPDALTRQELLRLREAAWRAWFTNDRAAFERIVPQELVALGWGGGAWQDRPATLEAMAGFARERRTIRSLEFPRNVFQQYGDVVILYTTFRIVLAGPDGTASETAGRGTEIFVRRNGHWIHTGWHLDTVT